MSGRDIVHTITCSCGGVRFEARGAPILSAICYCDDCQQGLHMIEALPDAKPALDPDGGSNFILYRKDRVACVKGETLLVPYKLKESSRTKRVVASCCNTAMMIAFEDNRPWVDIFRARFRDPMPPPEMRLQARFRPAHVRFNDDMPVFDAFPLRFMGRLLGAGIATLLRL